MARTFGFDDPKAAYDKLARPRMPITYASPGKYIQHLLDAGFILTEEQQKQISADFTKMFQHYFSLDPPTQYEDPNRYSSMVMTFDGLLKAVHQQGKTLSPRPLLATLPSGDVNARILREPRSGTPIIFFEQALFRFFHDFAVVLGWAFPPISLDQLQDDAAIVNLLRRYTRPEVSSEYFASTLYNYVVHGNSLDEESQRLPEAPHNVFMTRHLLQAMEWFIMGHELAHLMLGHLERDSTGNAMHDPWKREHEADVISLDLMLDLAKANQAGWAVNYWACHLALTLYHCLYRAIAFMQFGTFEVAWSSPTHPDPASRSLHLIHYVWRNKLSWRDRVRTRLGLGGTAAGWLRSMTDVTMSSLMEITLPLLFSAHQRGVRPSPVWSNFIATNFRCQTGRPNDGSAAGP